MVSRFSLHVALFAITVATVCSAQMLPGTQMQSDATAAGLTRPGTMMTSIMGQVRGPNNQAIGNARVEVHDMRNGSTLAFAYTRPNGSFELNGIPVGTYEVVATQGIHEARQRVDTTMGDGTVDFRMNVGDAASGTMATVSVAEMKVPAKAQNSLREAQKKFEKRKLDDARKELAKALDIYPQYGAALTLRGIINLEQGKMDDGRNDLEAALKHDPNYGLTYFALGTVYNSSGHFDDAIRTLDRGISLMPNSWQPQYEMARAYLGKGQFDLALEHVVRAERLAPKVFAPVYLVKAHALLGMRNYGDAISELERYLAAEPNGANAVQARQELNNVKSFTSRAQR